MIFALGILFLTLLMIIDHFFGNGKVWKLSVYQLLLGLLDSIYALI